jgi:Glycosyltransferase
MKLLVLLTSAFPYDGGEDFLSAEVNYISGFDRVVICPCNLKSDSVVTKRVPAGILVVPLKKTDLGKSGYAKLAVRPYVLGEMGRLMQSGRSLSGRTHEMLFFMKHAAELYESLRAIPEIQSADEITLYSYWFYDAAAAGALLAADLKRQGKRVKQISRAHGFDIHPERAKYEYLPMRKFLLSQVDRLYPCSRNGAEAIVRRYPEYAEKVCPSLLGTADCGVTGGKRGMEFRLLSCSYMVPVKRLHLIIEALALADFPIRWTHLGSGPLEPELRQLADGLPAQVHAEFPGQMENTAIMRYYRENPVSAFANVSSSEGIPVSVMEALSFGIPVVATDVGGTGEAVQDGVNGFLIDKDFEPAELLAKLRQLRDMPPEAYDRLCTGARDLWEEKFSAAGNFSRFYEEISK